MRGARSAAAAFLVALQTPGTLLWAAEGLPAPPPFHPIAAQEETAAGEEDERSSAVAKAVLELEALEAHLSERPESVAAHLQRVRLLYFLSIDEEEYLDRAAQAVQGTRSRLPEAEGEHEKLTLDAYDAALDVLRGKHAFWPPSRLRHLRRGLASLDEAVGHHPGHAELRYLRLVSGFYLPGIFGRGDEVRDDLHTLERILPAVAGRYPASATVAMASFVLEHGVSGGEVRERLRRTLADAEGELPDA